MGIAEVIHYIHVSLFLFGIFIPFTNNKLWLLKYSICVPFLFFHWSINDDTCAITFLEQYIRGERDKHRTFIGQIMNGLYILPEDHLGIILKSVFFSLWLFVQYRLERLFF